MDRKTAVWNAVSDPDEGRHVQSEADQDEQIQWQERRVAERGRSTEETAVHQAERRYRMGTVIGCYDKGDLFITRCDR